MDEGPRTVFALIRDGFIQQALAANTAWFCVSCYQCMVQCPQQIPITDIMYKLKEMSISYGLLSRNNKLADLYAAFHRQVMLFGKVSEAYLMADYGLRHPLDLMANTAAAVKLLVKKRLHLVPRKVAGIDILRHMLTMGTGKQKEPGQ